MKAGEEYNKIVIDKEKINILLADKEETESFCSIFVTTIAGNPRYTAFINGISKTDEKFEESGLSDEKEKEYLETIRTLRAQVKKSDNIKVVEEEISSMDDVLINWEGIQKTTLAEIDDQHKKLIELINKLHEGFKNKKAKKEIKDNLKSIIDYTAYHFGTEENYFEAFNFEDADDHIKNHKQFIKQLTDFQSAFSEGKEKLNMNFLNDLKEWFTNHIANLDSIYIELFKDNGVK